MALPTHTLSPSPHLSLSPSPSLPLSLSLSPSPSPSPQLAVYDYVWEEEGRPREVTTHVSIHTLHLDGTRE